MKKAPIVDILFRLDDDLSGGAVATLSIGIPAGTLIVMGEPRIADRVLHTGAIHVHGVGIEANDLGVAELRRIVDSLLRELDCDELVIEGAARTTGANPGPRTSPIRLARRPRSPSDR